MRACFTDTHTHTHTHTHIYIYMYVRFTDMGRILEGNQFEWITGSNSFSLEFILEEDASFHSILKLANSRGTLILRVGSTLIFPILPTTTLSHCYPYLSIFLSSHVLSSLTLFFLNSLYSSLSLIPILVPQHSQSHILSSPPNASALINTPLSLPPLSLSLSLSLSACVHISESLSLS